MRFPLNDSFFEEIADGIFWLPAIIVIAVWNSRSVADNSSRALERPHRRFGRLGVVEFAIVDAKDALGRFAQDVGQARTPNDVLRGVGIAGVNGLRKSFVNPAE